MQMSDMVLLHKVRDMDGDENLTGAYGPELLLDCRQCDPSTFTRESIEGYMKALCKAIGMDAEDFHFWDDEGVAEDKKQTAPHAKGSSVGGVFKKKVGIQFIITSSIVVHTLHILERVYVDIFSCKLFDDGEACRITQDWFKAKIVREHLIQRD